MPNEHVKAQFDDILDGFRRSMDELSVIKRKQAELTASGHAADKRVTISVDAQGRIVSTRFTEDITDLDYDEIAEAVTTAARAAQDALAVQTEEILRPLREQQGQLPKITDLVAGLSEAESYASAPLPGAESPRDGSEPGAVPGSATSGPETGVRETLW